MRVTRHPEARTFQGASHPSLGALWLSGVRHLLPATWTVQGASHPPPGRWAVWGASHPLAGGWMFGLWVGRPVRWPGVSLCLGRLCQSMAPERVRRFWYQVSYGWLVAG